jgi:hypothetical protein
MAKDQEPEELHSGFTLWSRHLSVPKFSLFFGYTEKKYFPCL